MHLLKPKDMPTLSNIVDSAAPGSQKDSQVNTENTPNTRKV